MEELDRDEQLVRWYELRNRLDEALIESMDQLRPAPPGCCADCARDDYRVWYAERAICRVCAAGRLRVRHLLQATSQLAQDEPCGGAPVVRGAYRGVEEL